MSGQETRPPDAQLEANVRKKKLDKRNVRRGLRLARAERNTVLAAAVGGVSTAFANGLFGFVVEAVRAVLGQ
ncbi:hypothetical protein ACGFRB_08470 [Streptomyces sp. NPDC048718]|uniref:hypothetical protein n=1 Tax=Streptomyces sp. NPDC048718 TaxID=3365587 RepID=UPI003715A3B4